MASDDQVAKKTEGQEIFEHVHVELVKDRDEEKAEERKKLVHTGLQVTGALLLVVGMAIVGIIGLFAFIIFIFVAQGGGRAP